MIQFALAYALFLGAHILPARTGLRRAAIARLGRGGWIALYALVSTALLIWLVAAAIAAPRVMLWAQTLWGARAAVILSGLACLMLAAGSGRANPASISFIGGAGAPGIAALIRHPILWAFALWSLGHLLANGELAVVALFGGFALFSLIGMMALDARAARDGIVRPDAGSFVARLIRALDRRLALELAAGAGLFALLLWLHPALIGPDPLSAAGWR